MKVTLFLMTEKGYNVLKTIIENNLISCIDLVIINKDSAVINDFSTEIKHLALHNNLPCKLQSEVKTIHSEYAIAVSWRWLINVENTKLIVIHDSYLPKYRGFAPLVNSLINGENELGVTALFASDEYDKGNIICQDKINISYPIKIQEAIEKVAVLYNKLILELVSKIKNNEIINSFPQIEDDATYSLWRDNEDYFIDWNSAADDICKFVDAVGFPYNGAKAKMDDNVISVNSVSLIKDVKIENRQVGKIIFMQDAKPVVVCKSGLILIQDAFYEETKESVFPLKKFRIKFN